MARTRTRDEIETAARVLADQVSSGLVSSAQAVVMIDQSVAALWDLLVVADPTRYMIPTSAFTTTAGTLEYELDSSPISITDFYKGMGVDLVIGGRSHTLERFDWGERNDYQSDAVWTSPWGVPTIKYDFRRGGIDGGTERLVFSRDPGAQSFKLWYIQAPQLLTSGSTAFNGVAGFEDYVIYDVAAKMATKEESFDVVAAMTAERERVSQRISTMARGRDAAKLLRVQDTRTRHMLGRRPW